MCEGRCKRRERTCEGKCVCVGGGAGAGGGGGAPKVAGHFGRTQGGKEGNRVEKGPRANPWEEAATFSVSSQGAGVGLTTTWNLTMHLK